MNHVQIECFTAAARLLSTTQAADVLHLSQQTVSKYIINLERELGVELFDRQGDGLSLTHAGEIYNKICLSAINSFKRTHKETELMYQYQAQEFRIGYSMWLDPYGRINEGVSNFQVMNKGTVISGRQYGNDELMKRLYAGDLDVAILSGAQMQSEDKELVWANIAREDISLFAPSYISGDTIDPSCWGLPYIHTSSWKWSYLEWQRIGQKEAQDLGLNPQKLKRPRNIQSVFLDLEINPSVFVDDATFGKARTYPFLRPFSLNIESYLSCVWNKCSENPHISNFVCHMQQFFGPTFS